MNARQTMVFGDNADDYRAFRPHYPDALFAWLASAARQDRLAWDCGAGSGQAALGLSRHFTRVLATDPIPGSWRSRQKSPMSTIVWRARKTISACARRSISSPAPVRSTGSTCRIFTQTRGAPCAPRGSSRHGPMTGRERMSSRSTRSCAGSKRIFSAPSGRRIRRSYFDRYETLPFPFKEIDCPPFHTPVARSKGDLVSFLKTWSAVEKYRLHYGRDPLALVDRELEEAWSAHPPDLPLCVPLYMRCGVNAP